MQIIEPNITNFAIGQKILESSGEGAALFRSKIRITSPTTAKFDSGALAILPILPSSSAAQSPNEDEEASAAKKLAGIQESRRESDATALEAIISRRLDFADDDADDERSYFNGSPTTGATRGFIRVKKMEQTLKTSYKISGEPKQP